ncbi:DUF4279 domain-containing protein [Neisseria elongata]|uniref:DUF4279 domain-containing protein n=1 Tax=Neisseria elongata TaxID=495 RepID=UPI002278521A|nr:DUF4279 domain-containing protein [Neisseria elongata]
METTNLNECYIYFALTGNGFDPDKISTTLNLKATKIVREGSRIPGKIPVCSSWKYGTPPLKEWRCFPFGRNCKRTHHSFIAITGKNNRID